MSNHQWAQADRLDDPDTVYDDSTATVSYLHYATPFGDASYSEPVADPPADLSGYFTAWYKFTASSVQQLRTQSISTAHSPTVAGIWVRNSGSWTTVAAPDSDHTAGIITVAGTTYYTAVSFTSAAAGDAGGGLIAVGYIGPVPPDPQADLAPVTIPVALGVRVGGEVDVAQLPAVPVNVRLAQPQLSSAVQLPPVIVHAAPAVPGIWTGSFVLSAPQDLSVVATSTPDFVVGVLSDDDDDDSTYTIQVQYAGDAAFTSPVTLSADAPAVDGGAILSPTGAVPDSTWWRARLVQDGQVILDWSAAQSFTVDADISATSLPLTWSVAASAGRDIHLWHLDPPGPDIGDTVTVYGHGFPDTGHLSLGTLNLDVASWVLVPATADNSDDELRVIDGDTVTCEHYEVTFVAPTYDGPGAALTVEA